MYAADGAAAAKEMSLERTSATVAKAGDQVMLTCPAGSRAIQGNAETTNTTDFTRTHYRSEPTADERSWIVRVVSTERTASWELGLLVFCDTGTAIPVNTAAIRDMVIDQGTLTSQGGEVVALCPAGYEAVSGSANPRFNQTGITADGNGVYVREICEWSGEPIAVRFFLDCKQLG